MKHYRPLLLQEIDVRLPGLHARRLRLNRHLPQVDMLAQHSHPFTQILCYLNGRGAMTVGGKAIEVGPGSVAFMPPREQHSFRETSGRRPLCLVLDLEWRGSVKHGFSVARLSQSDTGAIRQDLSDLTRLHDPVQAGDRLLVASSVLRILDVLLRGLNILPVRQRETPAFVRQFDRLLKASHSPLPPITSLATQMGYQTDYLNRIFKQATGQTLREYRDKQLLEKAQRLLRSNDHIKTVCDELGFADQNYFSRWFKKQTGLQPRTYAAA